MLQRATGLADATFLQLFYSRIRRPKPCRQSANLVAGKKNFDKLGRGPNARLVRSRHGPNNLALVKKLSLTIRGGGGHSEMRFPQCQHQGG